MTKQNSWLLTVLLLKMYWYGKGKKGFEGREKCKQNTANSAAKHEHKNYIIGSLKKVPMHQMLLYVRALQRSWSRWLMMFLRLIFTMSSCRSQAISKGFLIHSRSGSGSDCIKFNLPWSTWSSYVTRAIGEILKIETDKSSKLKRDLCWRHNFKLKIIKLAMFIS